RTLATGDAESQVEIGADSDRPELWLLQREVIEVLHEEVDRLPEKYRRPVVLCDLEGLTHAEAARRLGAPVNTVSIRLIRARRRLCSRLTRRGMAPTIGMIAAALAPGEVRAAVSEALETTTLRAAITFTTEKSVAGTVSASVLTLIE